MRLLFIESRGFTDWLQQHLDDQTYAAIQKFIASDPEAGKVIPGCGGLRKLRIRDPGRQKGKRGGARIVYLHVPEANWLYLLDAYGKDEKSDLTPRQKKELKALAQQWKTEAIQTVARTMKGKPDE